MPGWIPILIIVIIGVFVGLIAGTKFERRIKSVLAWLFCAIMLIGIVALLFKGVAFVFVIVAGFIAKIFS